MNKKQKIEFKTKKNAPPKKTDIKKKINFKSSKNKDDIVPVDIIGQSYLYNYYSNPLHHNLHALLFLDGVEADEAIIQVKAKFEEAHKPTLFKRIKNFIGGLCRKLKFI